MAIVLFLLVIVVLVFFDCNDVFFVLVYIWDELQRSAIVTNQPES